MTNLSSPQGDGLWTQGDDAAFAAYEGPPNGYASADFTATTGANGINSWYLSPEVEFRPGSRVVFHTRAQNNVAFADRLEIRACTNACLQGFVLSNPPFDIGNYTIFVGSINPDLLNNDDPSGVSGYPNEWTRFEFGAEDGVPQSGFGRIGFRYFVTDGGPDGQNSFRIGLDSVRIDANPVELR